MDIRAEFEAWLQTLPDFYAAMLWRVNKDDPSSQYVYSENDWIAYQAGRLAGQKDMRERAAKVAESGKNEYIALYIRDLPTEE